MEVKILTKTEEPLLSRVKVEGEVAFEAATPSKKDVKASVAKSMKKDIGLVEIDIIDTGYGQHKARVVSYVYETADMITKANKPGKKALEKIKKAEEEAKQKAEEAKKAAEETKKEATAKQEASEEKPAEEEPKAEEKKEETKAE